MKTMESFLKYQAEADERSQKKEDERLTKEAEKEEGNGGKTRSANCRCCRC